MNRRTIVWLSFAFLIAGCVRSPRVSNYVPARVTLGMLPSGQQPLYVGPISGKGVDAANQLGVLEGVGSSAELTILMEHSLRLHGLQIVPVKEQAMYTLDCSVSRLGQEQQTGTPPAFLYEAELTCTLFDQERNVKVWERKLDRDYTYTEVINTMGHLPQNPFKHERRLFQYCIVPLWDAMSGSVWAVFTAHESAAL